MQRKVLFSIYARGVVSYVSLVSKFLGGYYSFLMLKGMEQINTP